MFVVSIMWKDKHFVLTQCLKKTVENECTSHNFSLFAIILLKIIKIGGNLMKFWQKQFRAVFLDTVYNELWIEPMKTKELFCSPFGCTI